MIDNLYCAAVTPMSHDYKIDYKGLQANIEWYISSGLGGILICGGTGEFVSLSESERKSLVEYTAKAIDRRTGFMVGCSAETTKEAVDYARHAQSCGAESLLLIASYYFKPSEEELYGHFKAVAETVKIPVILYNNPGACGTQLTPRLTKQLARIDNIRYMKDASGDVLQFREIKQACPNDFHMLVGCDALAYELIKNGATGWISISANALARESQQIFDAMVAGEESRAWELYQKCLPIYAVCEDSYKAIQTIKYIMDRIGCCGGASRLPRMALTDAEKLAVDQLLKAASLL